MLSEIPPTEEPAAATTETEETNVTPSGKKPRKLFVGNVSQKTTETVLRDHFAQYGTISELQIMRNSTHRPSPGNHRGFGFIRYDSQEVTEHVQTLRHTVDGNLLTVNLAKAKTTKFFVGGIARDRTTAESMRTYFEQFGEIDDIFCIVDRGFGFVTLVDEGHNLKPIISETHHEIDGKLCEVRVARPKEEYQRSLQQRGGGRGGRRGGGRGRGGYGGYGGRGGWQDQYSYNPYAGYSQWQPPRYGGTGGAYGGGSGRGGQYYAPY